MLRLEGAGYGSSSGARPGRFDVDGRRELPVYQRRGGQRHITPLFLARRITRSGACCFPAHHQIRRLDRFPAPSADCYTQARSRPTGWWNSACQPPDLMLLAFSVARADVMKRSTYRLSA